MRSSLPIERKNTSMKKRYLSTDQDSDFEEDTRGKSVGGERTRIKKLLEERI